MATKKASARRGKKLAPGRKLDSIKTLSKPLNPQPLPPYRAI